jgi:serine protease
VTSGGSTTVSGKLTRAGTTTALADRPVQLQIRTMDASGAWSKWSNVGSAVRTTSTGAFAIAHRPPRNAQYRVVFAGAGSDLGSVGPAATVKVAPKVTAALSATSVPRGATVRLSGKVSPSLAGKVVHLQRKVDGRWVDVTSQKLSAESTYSFAIKASTKGTRTYRVRVPAYAPYTKATSPKRSVKIT